MKIAFSRKNDYGQIDFFREILYRSMDLDSIDLPTFGIHQIQLAPILICQDASDDIVAGFMRCDPGSDYGNASGFEKLREILAHFISF
jgi:hypothetical protein